MIDCIVVAAGQGRRMGAKGNKAYLPLAGKPILFHTLSRLALIPLVAKIFPIIGAEEGELFASLGAVDKVQEPVIGGVERADSVRNGLKQVLQKGQAEIVMVHDAARPFIDVALIQRLAQAAESACAVPVVPVSDTVRMLGQSAIGLPTERGTEFKVIDRGRLLLAQTPQAFPRGWIEEAFFNLQAQGTSLTDEGSYFEAIGRPVILVEGRFENFKITHPSDLPRAEAMIQFGLL